MIIRKTEIADVVVIEPELIGDERGFFARSFCEKELAASGVDMRIRQTNFSLNRDAGTLRGMHYQDAPKPEQKLVRCTEGALFDVAVDLRPESPTYCRWVGTELTAENRLSMLVPAGCAHGFITLQPDTEILYLMGEFYEPELARGVRWNDPAFGIDWPMEPAVISERDGTYGDYARQKDGA